MSNDIERVNEIEHLIATGEMSAAQVFTQMKQLLPTVSAQGAETVAWISEDGCHATTDREKARMLNSQGKAGKLIAAKYTRPLTHCPAAQPQSAGVPEGWDIEREAGDRITISADGLGFYVARMNAERIAGIMLYALANDLLTTPQPAGDWIKCSQDQPREIDVDVKLRDGSVICGCLAQSDGDFYWKGGGSEMFILEHEVVEWRPQPPREQEGSGHE